MATKIAPLSREAEIDQVMRETTLMRPEAAALVACRHGEDISDVVREDGEPLTAEERERLGLGRSIVDIVRAEMAEAELG